MGPPTPYYYYCFYYYSLPPTIPTTHLLGVYPLGSTQCLILSDNKVFLFTTQCYDNIDYTAAENENSGIFESKIVRVVLGRK